MTGRSRAANAAVGLFLTVAIATPAGTTRAAFSDTATVASASTKAFVVPAPAPTCSGGGQTVLLSWDAVKEPDNGVRYLDYSATATVGPALPVNGTTTAAPRTIRLDAGSYGSLLGLGGTFTVTTTASLRLSPWSTSSTNSIRMGLSVLGATTINCA